MDKTEFKDKTLICVDCEQEFTFTAGEQKFYWAKGLAKPRRCRECRLRRKLTIDSREVSHEDNG